MNRLKIKISAPLLVFSFLILGTGCKHTLDINQNPNFPTLDQGTPSLVLPPAVLATTGKIGADLAIVGGIWSQYFTQAALASQYKPVDSYNMPNTDFFVNDVYDGLFTTGLKNYQYVIDKSRESADWNTFLIATVMKAYTTGIMVDMYDQIPYSEALGGAAQLKPKFDDGYDIYTSLLSSLDSALNGDFSAGTNTNLGATDLVFGGDVGQWKLFANTLKLKFYLRMINAHADVAQSGITAMMSAGTSFLASDAAVTNFTDAPSQDNPFFEWNQRTLNTTANLKASATFVLWLEQANDPRIVSYFGNPTPNYVHQGDYSGSDPTYQTAATFVQSPTDPVEFISGAESYFLQAEADVRYNSGANAKALYDQGVLTAFADLGLDGSSFIEPGGAYEWGNESEDGVLLTPIQQIIRQKWASFPYGCHQIEGFFDKNRTGFPLTSAVYSTEPGYVPGQFVVGKNSVLDPGLLPKRFVFPYDETSRNSNAPQTVVPISTPVWWAQ
ncbi:MAG TPA: SusD/RagB family nutrient-binding outer membrane lipoprotein [Puia sp.]